MRELHCDCGELIVRAIDADDYTIKGKVTLIRKGITYSVCKKCDAKVPVDIKALMESKNLKLYVKK